MSVSPGNEMAFLWDKFVDDPRGDGSLPKVELIYDTWNPGDWWSRFEAWDRWRREREINGRNIDHYRELYLRIHGAIRQTAICGLERGLGRRNIYQYWWCGQENCSEELPPEVDYFDDNLIYHPPLTHERDVYISPHAKTQGNFTFTFDFWSDVVHRLVDAGVTVTVGYDGAIGQFCEDLDGHPLYRRHWGDHRQWMGQICCHRLVACGNTGTGWLAAACGVPMITMEPPGSQMPDHRYRECGLSNIVEVVDVPDAEEVQRVVVMTTGCYDVLHAGHVRHLERSRSMGTKLVVALNSDVSVRLLKGRGRPINPQSQRKAILEALRCVDEVRLFNGPNALPLIEEIKPQVITAGFGYKLEDIVGRELVEGWGGRAVITYCGDASDEPSTTKIVNRVRAADVVEVCRIGAIASVNPFEKLKLMADEFLSVKDLPGDVADLGAMCGGTSLILRRLAPDKELYLFDTWEGTPYNDPLCHHKKGEWAAKIDECMRLVGDVNYVQGVFPYTSKEIDSKQQFCFVYIDMDTYQATRDALYFFWLRMVPGGKILLDDYDWEPCAGVKKAVDELFHNYSHKRVVSGLHSCILERE
jgi:rfaE bifunctional protein nucleotidyltransferase chain/domain